MIELSLNAWIAIGVGFLLGLLLLWLAWVGRRALLITIGVCTLAGAFVLALFQPNLPLGLTLPLVGIGVAVGGVLRSQRVKRETSHSTPSPSTEPMSTQD